MSWQERQHSLVDRLDTSAANHCDASGPLRAEVARRLKRELAIQPPRSSAIKRRLKRALDEGELPASIEANRMAAFYATVAQGLGVRAGDGVSRAELMAVVDGAMTAWDSLVEGSRKRQSAR